MSERWPGGIVRATPVTPTGPFQSGTAPGIWTIDQANYWIKQGLWPTAGNFLAVEDVFSTWLYTGNGSTQTITNNINLSGSGGLVWAKNRSTSADHLLYDTIRGANRRLATNTTSGTGFESNQLNSFTSTGFTLGSDGALNAPNRNAENYASWTFREAPNFFDVVTYTGTGSAQNIAHSLGSVPGCILIKRTDTTADWQVYHRSNANTQYMVLNSTAAVATGATRWNSTTPTASVFTVGTDTTVNASGGTYVAYLFAHDATSDGIIQCGSYTGNGYSGAVPNTVTLGWEPQWVMVKKTSSASISDWFMFDNMRGMPVLSGQTQFLSANTTGSEIADTTTIQPTATGFQLVRNYSGTNANGDTYIYIAIRRGPMRTPTLGTTVFAPVTWSGNATSPRTITGGGFPVDLSITYNRGAAGWDRGFVDRLRGAPKNTSTSYFMYSNGTTQEITNQYGAVGALDIQDGVGLYTGSSTFDNANASGNTYLGHLFRRAPGFFDEVCYTGTGSARTVSHNLGVVPEMIIVKQRSSTSAWWTWCRSNSLLAGTSSTNSCVLSLNTTDYNGSGSYSESVYFPSLATSSVFSVASINAGNNASGGTYAAYLFASCPGVSKVGSYTGTGTTQTINCGFTTGARFVLIKRTDSTGDWYVWDSARGIVAGNDPYLLLNSTAAEVTSTDYVDTDNSGFQLSSTAPAALNANGGTYIFLAIS